jgi:hypothetical protein
MTTFNHHEQLRPIIKKMNATECIDDFEYIGVTEGVDLGTWIHWHHQEEARLQERNEAIANHMLWGEPWRADQRLTNYLLS